MATQSDKAKRAAATKAQNQRQQELDDQALIKSTQRKYCFSYNIIVITYNHPMLKSLVKPKLKH